MITKEELLKRLAALQEGRQSLLDQLNSCMGNIQDCQYWLAQLAAAAGDSQPASSGHAD